MPPARAGGESLGLRPQQELRRFHLTCTLHLEPSAIQAWLWKSRHESKLAAGGHIVRRMGMHKTLAVLVDQHEVSGSAEVRLDAFGHGERQWNRLSRGECIHCGCAFANI